MPPWNSLAPPSRRRRPSNKEEEMKEVVERTLKKCKTIGLSLAVSFPEEVLFEILLRLPAQDIYYSSRLVCCKWYHMMRTKYFIHKHLEHASNGLLYLDRSDDVVYISAREEGGGIDAYKLNYKNRRTVHRGTIWSSCNGLMLEYDMNTYTGKLYYYVVNVSTDQAFRLPLFPFPSHYLHASAIGYDAASMTYKVVVTYVDEVEFGYKLSILTVGVDKSWRKVRTDHLSEDLRPKILIRPTVMEGFLHWNLFGYTEVLSLKSETEIIVETSPPIPKAVLLEEKAKCCCVSTGRYISTFRRCQKKLDWEVFEMKPETGEWRKLPNICLEGQKRRIIKMLGSKFKHDEIDIKPYGWLKYPDLLALRIHCVIIFYNLITCEIRAEKLSFSRTSFLITPHKNSLVWLGGP